MTRHPACAVIIVTHNSQAYLPTCLKALDEQTIKPQQIIIVDSGSQDTSCLNLEAPHSKRYIVDLQQSNVGFCVGNNIGYAHVDPAAEYVLFLNPDAFLFNDFIEHALDKMEEPASADVGALSGLLLGYDMTRQQATGLVDSAGIFSTWYGRWYDRGQGQKDGHYRAVESVPALCGAVMFCRKKALDSILLKQNQVMDPAFYMYKEDIDLSLRLRKKGWQLLFCPRIAAYHCRGWQTDRTKIPQQWRLLSAKNEMRLYQRLKSPKYLYSLLKYTLVRCFNI